MKAFIGRAWPAIVAAVAGLAVTFHEYDWPSNQFWDERDQWVFAAALVVVGVALVDPLVSGWVRARDRRARKRAALATEVLRYALVKFDAETEAGLTWHKIAIHVWDRRGFLPGGPRLAGSRFSLVRRLARHCRRLEKVASLRFEETPGKSGITWTRGKGVVGQCWEKGVVYGVNIEQQFGGFLGGGEDKRAEWDKQSAEYRLNMTWQELQITGRFGGVFAAPMYDTHGRFRGCVSVDAPSGSFRTLSSTSCKNLLVNTANACASSLYRAQR